MAITSSNIHEGALSNPLDSRYVPVYEQISDLPEVTSADNDALAVTQEGGGVYQVVNGAWLLLGALGASGTGGGGGGDMFKTIYDSDNDGKVNAALTADTATSATSAATAATAASADTAVAVTGITGAAASTYYGKNRAGTVGFHSRVRLTTSASSDPTVNDDSGDGYVVPWFWRRTSNNKVWILVSDTVGAAVWLDITSAASVTGLTNPLVATFDADGNTVKDAAFQGFVDSYYDLSTDPDGLVVGGVASLVPAYNGYTHASLASALEINLPSVVGLGANQAPFGVIGVRLASGGSVSIGSGVAWSWETSSPNEPAPSIPTSIDAVFRLRYSYDPTTSQYALSMSHLTAPVVASTAVTYVATSASVTALSEANKDSHPVTHNYVSTTQDGTVYLLIGAFFDGTAGLSTPGTPAGITPINAPPTGSGSQIQNYWYYYKPTQGELDTGTFNATFTKTNETGQIVTLEAAGAHATNPVGNLAFDRSGSSTRTAIGPASLTAGTDGQLLVCSAGLDRADDPKPSLSVNAANDFTLVASYDGVGSGAPYIRVLVREVDAGTYSTPSFTRTADGVGFTQLEAFALVPNA